MSEDLTLLARATMITHDAAAPPVWSGSHDADLHAEVVEKRRPLLLVARNSDSAGRQGCQATAEDMLGCVETLAKGMGFDVRPCLPTAAELAEWLFHSPYKVTSNDGDTDFVNRFCLVWIPQANVCLSLSAGSAVKLDGKSLKQPHAEHLKRTLMDEELRLCGLYTKRFDRLVRNVWAAGDIVEALSTIKRRHGSAWGGDGEQGRWDMEEFSDLMFAFRGHGARTDARNLKKKRHFSMILHTGERMENGRVPYPFAQGIPPGTMRFVDRRNGSSWLTIDSPEFYPSHVEAERLPEVRQENGDRVDQAESTAWFLARLGKPEFPAEGLIEELVARRFSTEGLRFPRANGAGAYLGFVRPSGQRHRVQVAKVVASICNHLDFYRTGILRPQLGGTTLEVGGIFPATGFWMQEEDGDRISDFLAGRRKPGRRPSGSWAGMSVTANGVHRLMVMTEVDGEFCWRLRRDPNADPGAGNARSDGSIRTPQDAGDTSPAGKTPSVPPIPDDVLVSAILEAVIAADGKPLEPFLATDATSSARRVHELRLANAKAEHTRMDSDLAHRAGELLSTKEDGSPKLGPSLWERASAEYEKLAVKIERLHGEVLGMEVEQRSHNDTLGLDVAAMTALVNDLRNPSSNRVRNSLRRGLHDFVVESDRVTVDKQQGYRVVFRGRLVFKTPDGPQSLPFEGTYTRGAITRFDDRTIESLAQLRAGHVTRNVSSGLMRQLNSGVAKRLGHPNATHFVMGSCAEPDLLRLGMATLYPDAVEGEDPAAVPRLEMLCNDPVLISDFKDVGALASAIERAHSGNKRAAWLQRLTLRQHVEGIIACAVGRGPVSWEDKAMVRTLRGRGLAHRWAGRIYSAATFVPCNACGNPWCAPMQIREVTGYLCLNAECRLDEAGVRWPSRFDKYIEHPRAWIEAGVDLDIPDQFDLRAKELVGEVVAPLSPPRTLPRLDPTAVSEAVEEYLGTDRPVKQIAKSHGMALGSLYYALDARGIGRDQRRRNSA